MPLETQTQLAEFHRFVGERLQAGARLTPEEVLEEWQLECADVRHEENVRAVQEALDELAAGDQGTPMEVHLEEMRELLREMDHQ
jgi:hypothetical protein